jgi:hypothetical protein
MGEINPAIPSSGSEGTGRVVEALVCDTESEILGIYQGRLIHLVIIRVVLDLVVFHTGSKTVDVLEIGLYVGLPLSLGPRGT